ncbi:MAG: HAD hydrolase family protein [Gemmatimonadetes bacterium]|nr:HAD hydrolase family protein [Gemmatimonadota bacterium]NIO31140.1 HAD hydrolase family protein [Gemmatimonadota bacterium]
MRPLAELDAASCQALIGVAFDIDDTVTRAGRLELAAFQAMHELAASGLHLVAVTGRPLGWADVVANHWPVDAAVGENGAGWVWRDGERPCEGYFEPEERRRTYPDLFERVRRRVAMELPHVKPALDQRARRCDLAFDVGETVRLPVVDIERLVGLIEAEGARSAVSSVHAHAIPGDWDKARGIERAARDALDLDTDADRERWLFIGDSGNDAAAFEYFPLSVGVSNVRDYVARLPAPPRFITGADRGEGFAEMTAHLLEARR